MSTDGPQPPPSIAPKTPARGVARARTATDGSRPGSAFSPAGAGAPSGSTAPGAQSPSGQSGSSGAGGATAVSSTPVADRQTRPSQGASGRPATAFPAAAPAREPGERRPVRGASTSTSSTATAPGGPRRVRLAVARIDPWSVMKLAFLLSVAVGIMIVVAAAVVWYTLDGLAVFTKINGVIATLSGSTEFFDITEYASFERVISLATMIGVIDMVLLTALSTIGAFLYNIVAALVGGIHLTLTDD